MKEGQSRTLHKIPIAILMMIAALALALAQQKAGRDKSAGGNPAMTEVRFMTLDPGHFHAGLVQKEMYQGVSKRIHVYAPLGGDLIEHLGRVSAYNTRKDNPTSWELEMHTGPDFMERMLKEHPGNVVMLFGRNLVKIDRIKASVEAGLNVLADKPWIIEPADLPKLESALEIAEGRGLVAYDIMTERYEITSMLQKELVNDPRTFGSPLKGSITEPAVYMESVHHLLKMVSGMPNRRPAWFFDVRQQGEGLPDVGTHLVDLVAWMLFPEQGMDYHKDIQVGEAKRWPTVMTRAEFQRVTGEPGFPDFLKPDVKGDKFEYFCNTQVSYALRGVNVKLDALWKYEPPEGAGDTHSAYFKGSHSRIEIRQGKSEMWKPELYVVPNTPSDRTSVLAALQEKVRSLQARYPGVAAHDTGKEYHIMIPDSFRNGHEAHFAQVTNKFLGFLKDPGSVPKWEKANMVAKYYVTTKGLELSRQNK